MMWGFVVSDLRDGFPLIECGFQTVSDSCNNFLEVFSNTVHTATALQLGRMLVKQCKGRRSGCVHIREETDALTAAAECQMGRNRRLHASILQQRRHKHMLAHRTCRAVNVVLGGVVGCGV